MLRKIKVTNGVYWVEIPEAELSILCGAPADVVKHMMRTGLIVEVEQGGVVFESGPNAILLSDVMLQGEALSNLGEFPVLQMLYRQGMILPGHPNNTGIKPLIMGSAKQVDAQMKYIFRGNYGLVSEQELVDTGLDEQTARDLMRLKLKFSFGHITEPKNLIDTMEITKTAADIRNGVTVRRVSLNVFEFAYQGKTVEIDLNLSIGETYGSPYPLGYYKIDREYFSVLHSGDGDGWDINRPTMSSILIFRGDIYLIDAGPNLDTILNSLGIGINEIKGIFHTHSHDDHFAGLTSLIRADHKIKYYATPFVRAAVTQKLSALLSIDEGDFAAYFDIHDLKLDEWNDINGLEVKPLMSPHPVETTVFLFQSLGEDGNKTYAHFADIVSFDVLEKMVTDDDDAPGISQALFETVKENYLQRTDLKNIDIGGGMIHGNAKDFAGDTSGKIVLGHMARPLNADEKLIGSGAPFGTSDTLIPAYQNSAWRFAFGFLRECFPHVLPHRLQPLLNNPVVSFNPQTIVIKEGEISDKAYIVLFGNIESVNPGSRSVRTHSAGTLIGDLSALYQLPSTETFRASSFVQALRIPGPMFLQFVEKSNLFGAMSLLEENREILQQSRLFGDALSYPIQNKLAKMLKMTNIAAEQDITALADDGLVVVVKGQVGRMNGAQAVEILEHGAFFGEDDMFFNSPYGYALKTLSPATIFTVPWVILDSIPVVRWKLFETFEKRKELFRAV